MKRLLSVLLSLTLAALVLAPAAVPASAAAVKTPVINIVGEREVEVWKEDGTRYSPTEDMADAVVDDAIKELVPVFVKAFLTNNYDEWSRLALEKLTPIYDEIRPAPAPISGPICRRFCRNPIRSIPITATAGISENPRWTRWIPSTPSFRR